MSGLDFLLIVPASTDDTARDLARGLAFSAAAQRALPVDGAIEAACDQHIAAIERGEPRRPLGRRARDIARLDTIVDALNPTGHDPGDEDRER